MTNRDMELAAVQLYIRQIIDPILVKLFIEMYSVDDPNSVSAFADAILMTAARNFLVGNKIRVEENGTKIFNVCPIPLDKKYAKGDIILELAARQDRVIIRGQHYGRQDWLLAKPYNVGDIRDIVEYTIVPEDEFPYRW